MADTIRRRMLPIGARHALAPVLDITPRPALGPGRGDLRRGPLPRDRDGLAYVRGIQGAASRDGVVATGKHMVGHGLAEGGLNQAPVHAGRRELRDEQLPPFEAAVREAGSRRSCPPTATSTGCRATHRASC